MTLDNSTLYGLLGNDRRRSCLEQLAESETEWTVRELAEAIADDVTDASTPPEEVYNSVYISLCQNHLPKLDTVALIRYDNDAKTVSRGAKFDEVEQHLRVESSSWTPLTRYRVFATSVATVGVLAGATVASGIVTRYLLALVLALHIVIIVVVGIKELRSDDA